MSQENGNFYKKPWLWVLITIGVVLLLIALISATNKKDSNVKATDSSSKQKVYNLKVSSVKANDTSDWEISGTTSAPDGAKVFATYGDSSDTDYFGVNAATSKSMTSWAKVNNGKFTMLVDPLTLHYYSEYKTDTPIKAYLFAVTDLKGSLSKYNVESKISDDLQYDIAKNIKKTNLVLNKSQADYYNSLGSSSSSEKPDDDETSSSSSEATDASSSDDASSYQTGITYDQIARTPDDYKGKKMQFTGKVVQVMEDDDETQIRLAVDGNSDNIILVGYDPDTLKGSRVLEDDLVTISGDSVGTVSYKSAISGKITVPAIYAKIVNDQGKASDDYGY
ncbi:tcdA-E operon negative regulator [Leuconostoc kimchii IMSNU 11154]|uniref:TcdA-E operon negative regulator n=1 Tax=Leuconostoc kimchii (strain IMSNU 11154 / KCTC 2386 / IH25) TaxID=762051 RepID=D5T0Z2_LEUKI|nr:hypothetical protein [Leuconostoc kimchii]ADG39941.1 tcdA-E operon negative regulator [Leuconostoc kimchii IMSNU 11154]